jgi:membrane fusion protein (multidrug efflux system)
MGSAIEVPTMSAVQTLEPAHRIVDPRPERSHTSRELPLPPPAAEVAPKTPRKKAPLIFGALLAIAAAGGAYIYVTGRGRETTDNAQVEGHVSSVAARVSGQVVRVLVQDNQEVQAGDILVELDDRDLTARLAGARADLAAAEAAQRTAATQLSLTEKQAKANLRIARGGVAQAASVSGSTEATIEQARADIAAAESRRTLARTELDRSQRLLEVGAVTQSELDTRQAAIEQADAAVAQARARLVTAMASRSNGTGTVEAAQGRLLAAETAPEQVEAARAQLELATAKAAQARAAVEQAELNLGYTKIRAEIAGTVARRTVEPGQLVSPDRPLLAIVGLGDTWVVANFKETQLADMRPGQKAHVEVDTYGGVELTGHIDSIAAGTGSRFSLLPPDNASGNFTKVTQRVPVLVRLDDRKGLTLRPGMSAEVTVVTE